MATETLFSSLTLRSILTWASFCHSYSLPWPFHEEFLLHHESCLVGNRSDTSCALLSQVLPPLIVSISRLAASLCLGQVGFSSVILSCCIPGYCSPPFHWPQFSPSPHSWSSLAWTGLVSLTDGGTQQPKFWALVLNEAQPRGPPAPRLAVARGENPWRVREKAEGRRG